jgi:hypothetical protein
MMKNSSNLVATVAPDILVGRRVRASSRAGGASNWFDGLGLPYVVWVVRSGWAGVARMPPATSGRDARRYDQTPAFDLIHTPVVLNRPVDQATEEMDARQLERCE